ncbi:MAG: hypothetical protein M0Z60_13955 [Nitrospiraceae bacterium]|nr:hypothetical protein [Nitrospiraceae bacterium]
MRKNDANGIAKEFRKRQTRQIVAAAAALFVVLFVAVVHKRPDLFGELSSGNLFAAQVIPIAAFIGYTAMNWRCPSCGKYLGSDIYRSVCKKCGARLR